LVDIHAVHARGQISSIEETQHKFLRY
jgi:hypothetical protein